MPIAAVTLDGIREAISIAEEGGKITQRLSDYLDNNNLTSDPKVAELVRDGVAQDYVIFNVKGDENVAKEIHQRFQNLGLVGFLFDELKCPASDFAFARKMYKMATIKFFVVTNNIGSANDASEVMKQKTEFIQQDLRKGDKSIVPIWMVDKYDLDDEAFDALYGLGSVAGLDPHSSYFDLKVKRLKDDPSNAAKKRAFETEQLKKLVNYLKQMEKNPPKEPKGPKYKPDADGPPAPPVHVKNVVNNYYGPVQSVPGPGGNARVVFTVDAEYWEEFARGRDHGRQAWQDMDTETSYETDGNSVVSDGASTTCSGNPVAYPTEESMSQGQSVAAY